MEISELIKIIDQIKDELTGLQIKNICPTLKKELGQAIYNLKKTIDELLNDNL